MASPISSWRPTAALLDWAFAHGTSLTPIGTLIAPGNGTRSGLSVAPGSRPQSPPTASPHALPQASLRLSALPMWFGLAGLFGALALVGSWARHKISRQRS